MRHLQMHLQLSQRRRNLFYGMYSGEPTSRLTEQKDTAEPRAQAAGIVSGTEESQEERGEKQWLHG